MKRLIGLHLKIHRIFGQKLQGIYWYHWYDKVLEIFDNHYRWCVGGCMNSCYNAIDLHVHSGNGNRVAIIDDSPVTNYNLGLILMQNYKNALQKQRGFCN